MGGKCELVIITTPAELAEVARLLNEPQVGPQAELGCKQNVRLSVGNVYLNLLNAESPHVKRMLEQQAQAAPQIVRASHVPTIQ